MSYTARSISNLKDQINIVDVVSRALPLRKAGASYKCVCPFHNEKTPSFNVNEQRQMYYCFGCQASGDVIEFVKNYYNLDFGDAVDKLAAEYGIEMEETRGRGEDLSRYYAINKDAAVFFFKSFTETANLGYAYMKNREITPQILKKFGIGYADKEWSSLYDYLKSKGHKEEDMLHLGLIAKSSKGEGKYYDAYRNRVMFPIINTRGKTIGFGGRAISSEDMPKYLNSQASKVFQKEMNLYGINFAKDYISKIGYLIVVEGYMDVIGLFQAGITNVVASLGTALTEHQARMIKRYTKKVVLCYDADNAGQNAAIRGMEILRNQGLDVRIMHVTDGKDPDEFIKQKGQDEFLKLVENAYHYGDYKIMQRVKGINFDDHNDRIKGIKEIARVLKDMSPAEREGYAENAAQTYGLSKAVILNEVSSLDDQPNNRATGREEGANVRGQPTATAESLTKGEEELFRLMMRNESYIQKTKEHLELLESDLSRRIFDAISDNITDDGSLDLGRLMDQLEDDDRTIVYGILENIVLVGDEEEIFNELLKRHRLNALQKEVERINELLKYGDSDGADSEEMEALMHRSLELQREISFLKTEDK